MCSYILETAASSAETVRIVCDDTDLVVVLVYRTWRNTIGKNIHMENWDGTVLDIRATVDMMGYKYGQLPGIKKKKNSLPGMPATLPYPKGKGKQYALEVGPTDEQ